MNGLTSRLSEWASLSFIRWQSGWKRLAANAREERGAAVGGNDDAQLHARLTSCDRRPGAR